MTTLARAFFLAPLVAACSAPATEPYDPIALARATRGEVANLEAGIPPMCYTATAGVSNPCWVCHTEGTFPTARVDVDLQREYAFSDTALENHWTNLFEDRARIARQWSDDEILRYLREDNVAPLRDALSTGDFEGYLLDLDFARGFDEDGFARDGSEWRALRYKPFPGTFWPTNGSSDDVFVRLPDAFRRDASGRLSRAIHRINFAILEAAMSGPPDEPTSAWVREVEPIDERIAGIDLDGDGALAAEVRTIRALPAHYVGAASSIEVARHQHPAGTEYLHTVRYVDPDAPDLRSRRVKELRYMRKLQQLDEWAIQAGYEEEADERLMGRAPTYAGEADGHGLANRFGWQLQGWIEDARGRLRLQTDEEHRFCMGCHTSLGVTLDSTFSMARKVPGRDGWRTQDLRGMRDVPQTGHDAPEALTYFRRVGGADELRANDEMRARFWPGGVLDEAEVRRAAPGGDRDLAWLLAPSRERALDLARAYRAIVIAQSFTRGRDPTLRPPAHVHRRITEAGSGLEETGRIHRDGRLTLRWHVAQRWPAAPQ